MSDIGNSYARLGRHSADLCLFLLVADCGQLSQAARLAGLSQPRLSQRIRALEDSLGAPLFLRHRRGMELTRAGMDLAEAVGPHLGEAARAFDRLSRRRRRPAVVIQTDLAFASFRFLPVFPSLCAAFPDLGLSLMTRQLPDTESAAEADLLIRMELPSADGPRLRCLFPERVSVVCSPGFRDRHPMLSGAPGLPGLPLIDLTSASAPPWFTWLTWLRRFGLEPSRQADWLGFNSYDQVIQAAEEGLGLALGWHGLIDGRLEAGTLVSAIPDVVESPMVYVLRMIDPDPAPEVAAVFDWIATRFAD